MGSEEDWAVVTACAFNMLTQEACAEVAKPEWWNDEGLKALSAREAPNDVRANEMRTSVLSGQYIRWLAVPRSWAELKKAATHFDRAAALHPSPVEKAYLAGKAVRCRPPARA